ncbi:MAG: hypothetical protein IJ270_07380 [Paludibacteraceae bacterium]|nr:hypothetical protein [Paludibacteraceae bacterium]
MEKNFEKLSIEEMSLVSGGGDFFGASPCAWAAGTLGGVVGSLEAGSSGGVAIVGGILPGAVVGEGCTYFVCN